MYIQNHFTLLYIHIYMYMFIIQCIITQFYINQMQNLKVEKNNHLFAVREDTKIGCCSFVIEDGPQGYFQQEKSEPINVYVGQL